MWVFNICRSNICQKNEFVNTGWVISIKFPVCLSGKESACQCRRHGFNPWVGKIPWRRKWQPTPVFLPGKTHGQRSLAGYSSWQCHKRVRHNWVIKQQQKAFPTDCLLLQEDYWSPLYRAETWQPPTWPTDQSWHSLVLGTSRCDGAVSKHHLCNKNS